MERDAVETMAKVAQKIAHAKKAVASLLATDMCGPAAYLSIRKLLDDCQELMAVYCDTAPIRLIDGQVDEIMENKNNVDV